MNIRSMMIAAVGAAGFFAIAPASAATAPAAPAVFELSAPARALATSELYSEARFHSRRGFHRRGFHRSRGFHGRSFHRSRGFHGHRSFHRGYSGRRGVHHRSFHRHGFHDRHFDRRGVHKGKHFNKKHGVIIRKHK